MKKLIALLLCLVMALSLVACGSKQDDTQAPADDQQGAEETSLVDAAKAEGIDAIGPCPPDSVFSQAIGGWYDIVVVMYHDQGHIPIKTVGFVYDREKQSWKAVEGVNITLGLPIVRVSVDHGTGYALAGTGTSNELSLVNSIAYAASFGKNRT